MKGLLFGLTWLLILSVSCVSGGSSVVDIPGNPDVLTAAEIVLSVEPANNEAWEESAAPAQFRRGVDYQGAKSIEMEAPYGETAVLWNFSELPANAEVSVQWAVNFDFFDTESWLSIAYLPGIYRSESAFKPRTVFNEHIVYKWADGDALWPDSSDGWAILDAAGRSDGDGNFTIIMIITKRGERPSVLYQYFTDPVVKAKQ